MPPLFSAFHCWGLTPTVAVLFPPAEQFCMQEMFEEQILKFVSRSPVFLKNTVFENPHLYGSLEEPPWWHSFLYYLILWDSLIHWNNLNLAVWQKITYRHSKQIVPLLFFSDFSKLSKDFVAVWRNLYSLPNKNNFLSVLQKTFPLIFSKMDNCSWSDR